MPSLPATSGLITSTLGTWATPVIGVKSRIGSYGSLAYSQGLIAWVATAPMTMVLPSGGAEVATGAGAVLDDHRAEAVLHPLGQGAGDDVERTAGRVGNDEAQRPGLREGGERRCSGCRQAGEDEAALHREGVLGNG